jgi:hypothetical protein
LGSEVLDDYASGDRAYSNFVENVLYYQRIFEYSADIQSILEMPYCLFQDLILHQIKLKKKENQELERQRKAMARPQKKK